MMPLIASSHHHRRSQRGLTLIEFVVVLAILVALAGIVIPTIGTTRTDSSMQATEASMVAIRDSMIRYWADTKYLVLPGPGAPPATNTAASDTDTTTLTNSSNRFQLRWLFENPANDPDDANDDFFVSFNPDTRLGWNGPYLVERTGDYVVDDTDASHSTGTNFSTLYGNAGGPAILNAVSTLQSQFPRALVIQAVDDGVMVDCRVVSAGENGRIDIPNDASTTSLTDALVQDDQYVAFTLRR